MKKQMFYRTQDKRNFWHQRGGYEYDVVKSMDHKIPKIEQKNNLNMSFSIITINNKKRIR